MNTQPIRKLPGAKKEFPFVKSTIDNRRPVKLAKPTVNATKPTTLNPDKIKIVPANSTMADGAPQMPKIGFRFQGFGSTSITAAIPNSQTIRPLPTHLNKKIHPRDWTFSPKPELSIAIKKTDGTVKPKPFKANPVPSSHYNVPYQTPKKSKTVIDKKPELADAKKTGGTDLKPFKANPVLSTPKITKTEVAKKVNAPGLVNRMWHSVIDPILHPHNEASPETVPLPDKKKSLDHVISKQFRAKPAPPTTYKQSIPVAPQKRLPVRNVKIVKHLDPAEKTELQEFELTEKAILQKVDAQQKDEMTPSRSLKKIGPGEDVQNADLPDHPGLANRMWHSMVDPIWHSKKPEPDEKSIAGNDDEEKPDVKKSDVQGEVEVHEDPQASEVDTSDKLSLDALMQLVPEAFHVQPEAKKMETVPVPDVNEIASNPDVVNPIREAAKIFPFTRTVESRLETEAASTRKIRRRHEKKPMNNKNKNNNAVLPAHPDTSEKSDLDVELPSVPEAHYVEKITKEIVTVAAVPDENEIAPNPEADLDPIREAVEILPSTWTVESCIIQCMPFLKLESEELLDGNDDFYANSQD
ncbi:hypothetical protein DAPPUDRAFT_329611 [Daphnia pulex]|uniref:Uncharacterized protein n=1 Tax=Daphnia pulex TaxID=6669 RepID=E9HH48_DAPPU|nr:hypothetical protein DAPPUDRAFT_329611 [Daphnia pulex]|eukprot:EFX68929.1 hypothetical protein DAPPUDRAFT_329611 [Daphnia pulex]